MRKERSKRLYLKRFLKIATLAVAVIAFLWFEQHYIMARLDTHQRRLAGFYMEEKDSLDMVILGASETYNGYVPARAWDEYGITSYLYGYQANPVTLWSYQLKEIEKTQHPDVLLVECNGAIYVDKELENPAEVRFMTDDMPFSKNKVQLIKEQATESKLSYYFPFLKYHGHLIPGNGTLSKYLLEKRGFNILRGAQARISGDEISRHVIDVTGDNSIADLDPRADAALRAFLEQCKESEIEHIVFIHFPHVVTDYNYKRFQRYHMVEKIVEEYGFDYVDMDEFMDEMDMTFKKDFLDCEHLSPIGARKLTDFMVPYIMERYDVTPREQSAKVIDQWEQSLDYYNRLFEYWQYFREAYPYEMSDEYGLNDNAVSSMRIDAYFNDEPLGLEKIKKIDLFKYALSYK